ncbi:polysaccharide deacetylase family protein [Streptomyces sp. G-G2]|uniref:polysaccharide deacetylase family protein n=1 Tax=Streptomyces sp. G-G2 TaxID=3046201 RepID=UPI0024B92617|nr:polysaccharide deacetylase family protein [Streptomyces sp. G-G2]MDJ0380506.1 polysaccharide deacetylase family protein [Streptomyces sp. G-G2]
MSADPDTAAAAAAPARKGTPASPWVLMYHSVAEFTDPAEDPYGITVTPGALEAQLLWLRARGLRGVSVGELLTARARGRGAGLVGLTFDDGYSDFLTHALPLLQRHGCTATLFVLPGRLGVDNVWDPLGPRKPLLSAEGIRVVAGAGQEIASHGLLHQHLTAVPDDVLQQELRGSRELLRELTGTLPAGFCYPYGSIDRRVVEATRAAGYRYACAIGPGALEGPYAMPRTHISQADGGARLRIKRLRHQAARLTRIARVRRAVRG